MPADKTFEGDFAAKPQGSLENQSFEEWQTPKPEEPAAPERATSPGGLTIPAEIKGVPTPEQADQMDIYSSQMSGPQAAGSAGVKDYVPTEAPDITIRERARQIPQDRRRLSSRGKAQADELPADEDLVARQPGSEAFQKGEDYVSGAADAVRKHFVDEPEIRRKQEIVEQADQAIETHEFPDQ